MKQQEKAVIVDEIAAELGAADAVLAVDYRGISVAQIAELRAQLGEAETRFRIVKNTLTRRAADKAGVEQLKEYLVGPTAFAFVKGDIARAAKALNKYARDGELMTFKGGLLEGVPLTADEIKQIARLPGRDQLTGQLAGLVAAPLTGIVRGLGGLLSGLAIALGQVKEALPDEGAERPDKEALPDEGAEQPDKEALPDEGAERPDEEKRAAVGEPEPEVEPEAEAEPGADSDVSDDSDSDSEPPQEDEPAVNEDEVKQEEDDS